jgi:hypothetical protein
VRDATHLTDLPGAVEAMPAMHTERVTIIDRRSLNLGAGRTVCAALVGRGRRSEGWRWCRRH